VNYGQLHAEMNLGYHVKRPLLLSDFNQNWSMSTNFRVLFNMQFHESSVLEFLHADKGTDRHRQANRPISAVLVANASKIAGVFAVVSKSFS
jgi:hypothetical protein